MSPERMIGSILRGALGVRRKRHHHTLNFLLGGRRSWLNASTMMAAAGVAWGLYETLTEGQPAPSAPPQASGAAPAPPPVPPIPTAEAASADQQKPPQVTPALLRVIRLTISAARADGTLSPAEESAILEHARAVGAEQIVGDELRQATPLAEIVAGAEPAERNDLYTLAYAIVRADEGVSGGERIYLAQLAHQLGLSPADVAALEEATGQRIAQANQ